MCLRFLVKRRKTWGFLVDTKTWREEMVIMAKIRILTTLDVKQKSWGWERKVWLISSITRSDSRKVVKIRGIKSLILVGLNYFSHTHSQTNKCNYWMINMGNEHTSSKLQQDNKFTQTIFVYKPISQVPLWVGDQARSW